MAGVDLAVALLARLARALSGDPARVFPGGLARVLPWRAGIPDKDLAGGLVVFFVYWVLWFSSVRISPRFVVFLLF